MPAVVTQKPTAVSPVRVDFGWYYGITPTRAIELTYQVGTDSYPPGLTSLLGATTITPAATGYNIATNNPATGIFNSVGRLIIQNQTTYQYALVRYTSTNVNGSGIVTQFNGCTTISTSTGNPIAFAANTPVADPRMYVDQAPLNQLITFDTADAHNLSLPITTIPPGVSINKYEWDFGNGEIGYGPQAAMTYTFTKPPPVIVKLTVTDSLQREFAVAHPLNLILLSSVYGTALRERG